MKSGCWGWERWALVAFLLLAWALRLPPALQNRLHPDEALYGYWGLLIGSGRDPWLATVPVYKPPLLPYLMTGEQALFGRSEFAARLLGLAPGLLMVPLAAALTRVVYGKRQATAAALGVALSPFAVALSASAFLDPLMVALGLAACLLAARGVSRWAGVLVGLSFATKQTGLVWLPLAALLGQIGGFGLCENVREPEASNFQPKVLLNLLAGFSSVVALVLAWDVIRVAQGAESFWSVGVSGYGGLRLIWSHELWGRLRDWLGLARYLFGSPVVSGALIVGLVALAWRALARRPYARESLVDLLLIAFSLIYLLLHWLLAFPVWDRYLLPLVPILALLLARIVRLTVMHLQSITRHLPSVIRRSLLIICHLAFVIFLIPPALSAAHSRYPIADRIAYDGIDRITAFLRDLPEGSVLYHRWLGWHYHYYLFDGPVYLAYWPTPSWLVQDVEAFGDGEPRYVAFPAWESSARVASALRDIGYDLDPVLRSRRRDGASSFTLYRIVRVSERL